MTNDERGAPRQSGASTSRRRRILVGITIGGSVGAEVQGLRRALGDPAIGRIEPHLTLVPPVDLVDERFSEALVVVEQAAMSEEPFAARLGPVGTFAPANPVVFLAWSDTDGTPAWLRTEALRERLCQGPLDRPASHRRPFVPHVTICRRMRPALIPSALELLGHFEAEVFVSTLAVMAFDPSGGWSTLLSVPLGGGRRSGRGGIEVEAVVRRLPDKGSSPVSWGVDEPRARLQVVLRAVGTWAAQVRRSDGDTAPTVGVLEGHLEREALVVSTLEVRPDLRRMGLGTRLASEAVLVAGRSGASRVELAEALIQRIGEAAAAGLGFQPRSSPRISWVRACLEGSDLSHPLG